MVFYKTNLEYGNKCEIIYTWNVLECHSPPRSDCVGTHTETIFNPLFSVGTFICNQNKIRYLIDF